MDTLHERLEKAFEALRALGITHNHSDFGEAIGKNRHQISAAFSNAPKRCTLGLMKAIAAAFPKDLNGNYLLTGVGPVVNPRRNGAPHYSTMAAAGSLLGLPDHDTDATTTFLPVNEVLPAYDFTVVASGRSMEPLINDGDTLYCRQMDAALPADPRALLGNIFVICSREGTVVKEVSAINEDTITLHSLNPAFRDTDLHFSSIISVAAVIGVLHPLDQSLLPAE